MDDSVEDVEIKDDEAVSDSFAIRIVFYSQAENGKRRAYRGENGGLEWARNLKKPAWSSEHMQQVSASAGALKGESRERERERERIRSGVAGRSAKMGGGRPTDGQPDQPRSISLFDSIVGCSSNVRGSARKTSDLRQI